MVDNFFYNNEQIDHFTVDVFCCNMQNIISLNSWVFKYSTIAIQYNGKYAFGGLCMLSYDNKCLRQTNLNKTNLFRDSVARFFTSFLNNLARHASLVMCLDYFSFVFAEIFVTKFGNSDAAVSITPRIDALWCYWQYTSELKYWFLLKEQ